MTKIEPFSIVAAILMLLGILIGGIFEILFLIVGAIFLSLSFKRFKKNPEYTAKWILYTAAVILLLSIVLRVVGIGFALI